MLAKKLQLDFGEVTILDRILIAEMKEGILFDTVQNKKLLELGVEYFKEEAYGYISNRTNSYAVDPLVYFDSANIRNLKAIAVVSSNEITRLNAIKVEQPFYKKENAFGVFSNLDQALNWMKFQLNL